MVTAETAVVLPAIALVVALAVAVVSTVTAQLRCLDAAQVAARLAARGEPGPVVRAAARALAPPGANVVVRTLAPDWVVVEVTASVRLPVVGAVVPAEVVRGTFRAPLEPAFDSAAR